MLVFGVIITYKPSVYLIGKNPKLKCVLDHFIYKQTETCGCC